MPSFFDNLLATTDAAVDAYYGSTYMLRWQGEAVPLTAIVSALDLANDTDGELIESVYSHTFEITAADVVFGGLVTLPMPGMQFAEDLGDGTSAIWEVVKNQKGRCYHPFDPSGRRLIVYANLIRSAETN